MLLSVSPSVSPSVVEGLLVFFLAAVLVVATMRYLVLRLLDLSIALHRIYHHRRRRRQYHAFRSSLRTRSHRAGSTAQAR